MVKYRLYRASIHLNLGSSNSRCGVTATTITLPFSTTACEVLGQRGAGRLGTVGAVNTSSLRPPPCQSQWGTAQCRRSGSAHACALLDNGSMILGKCHSDVGHCRAKTITGFLGNNLLELQHWCKAARAAVNEGNLQVTELLDGQRHRQRKWQQLSHFLTAVGSYESTTEPRN